MSVDVTDNLNGDNETLILNDLYLGSQFPFWYDCY